MKSNIVPKYYRYLVIFKNEEDDYTPILKLHDLSEIKKDNSNGFSLTDQFVDRLGNEESNPVVFFFYQIIEDDHVTNIAAVAMEGIEGMAVSNPKITAYEKCLLSDEMRRCRTWQSAGRS